MLMIPDQDRAFLKSKFSDELQNPVTIVTFTKKADGYNQAGLECEFCSETDELMNELAELSEKIVVDARQFRLDDQLVKELGIDKLPAVVLMRDGMTGVRYFGIPGGFEFSSLVEDIVDVSRDSTDLSPEVKDKVHSIDQDIHIQVFVTPTCPYCPSAVRTAHQMAIENPQHIKADAIEAAEFPHLVSKYGITAVPTMIINDQIEIEGALPASEFANEVVQATAQRSG
jgi:glutaredoxin-like protein